MVAPVAEEKVVDPSVAYVRADRLAGDDEATGVSRIIEAAISDSSSFDEAIALEDSDFLDGSDLLEDSDLLDGSDLIEDSDLLDGSDLIEDSDLLDGSDLIEDSDALLDGSDLLDDDDLLGDAELFADAALLGDSDLLDDADLLLAEDREDDLSELLERKPTGLRPPPVAEQPRKPPLPASRRHSPAADVLEPYGMTGLHMIEEVGDLKEKLAAILDEIEVVRGRAQLPRYTRRFIDELLVDLKEGKVEGGVPTASHLHDLADSLRRAVSPEDQTICEQLDRLAVTIDPSFLPAHHGLLAHSLNRQDWPTYVESLERFVEHFADLVRLHPEASSSLSSLLVELSLLFEFRLGKKEDAHRSLAQRAEKYADGYLLAHLNSLRLALSRGDSTAVVAAYQHLIELTSSPVQSAIALDLALYLWTERSDLQGAIAVVRAHLSQRGDSGYPYVLQLLAWQADSTELEIEVTKARIGRLVAEGKQLDSSMSKGLGRRRGLKRRVGGMFHRLFEIHRDLGEADKSAQALRDAQRIVPASVLYLESALSVAVETGDFASADLLLEATIKNVEDPERRASLWHRRARLAAEKLADPKKARACLLEALEAHPSFIPAAIDLGRTFMIEGQLEPYYELWNGLAASETPSSSRWGSDAGPYRRGDLLENLLERPGEAFDAYRDALDERPQDFSILCALERTGLIAENYEALAEVYLSAAGVTENRLRRSDLTWKAAQLLAREVGDIDRAITAHLEFLTLDPTHLVALKALIGLYRKGGYIAEAADLLEQVVELESNTAERRALREWLGYLASRHLHDSTRALTSLTALLAETPNSITAQTLLRASLLTERDWNGLERHCVDLSELVADESRRRDLMLQAALVSRTLLNDNSRARRHLEVARSIDPAWPPVLDLLEEVCAEEGDYEALVDLLVDRAAFGSGEERGRAIEQAATIALDYLEDQERAEQLFTQALDFLPADGSIWGALGDLLYEREGWADLLALNRRRLSNAPSRAVESAVLHDIVALTEDVLDDSVAALDALERLLALDPNDLWALRRRLNIQGQNADLRGEAETHGRLAELVADRDDRQYHLLEELQILCDVDGVVPVDKLARVIEECPEHPVLERVLMEYSVDREHLGALIEVLRGRPEARYEVQRSFDQFALAEHAEANGRLDTALQLLNGICTQRKDFTPAFVATIRVLDKLGEHSDSASTALELASRVDDSLRMPLYEFAADRLLKIDANERRADVLRKILQLDPSHVAFDGLRAHYQKVGDVERLSALLALRTDPASVEARVAMLREIAQLHQVETGSKAHRHAIEELVRLLPEDFESHRRLAELEELESRFARAATCWERALQLSTNASDRRNIMLKAAWIWREHCDMPQRAIELYAELLKIDRDDPMALEGMARALVDNDNAEHAIVCYRRLFKLLDHIDDRRRVGLHLGALYRDRLSDHAEAARWFIAVGEIDPDCEEATNALIALGMNHSGQDAQDVSIDEFTTVGVTPEQLDRALTMQLEALYAQPSALPRYDKLARLLLLRDPQDPRAAAIGELMRGLGRLDHDLERSLGARPMDSPKTPLSGVAYLRHLIHPWARGPLFELFVRLSEPLGRIVGPSSEAMGVTDADFVAIGDPRGIAHAVGELCRDLGMSSPDVLLHSRKTHLVEAAFAPRTSLVIGEKVLGNKADPTHVQRERFCTVRQLEALRDAKGTITVLSAAEVEAVIRQTLRKLFPDLDLGDHDDDEVTGGTIDIDSVSDQLARSLPRRKRRGLRQIAEDALAVSWDVAQWCRGLTYTSSRSALLFSGFEAALDVIGSEAGIPTEAWRESPALLLELPVVLDLLSFILGDDFVRLSRELRGNA